MFESTGIEGLIVVNPKVFKDDRGYFFESYNERLFKENGIDANFVQDNQSFSTFGTIRGLHSQLGDHAQAKLVRVLDGEVLDVAVDVRPGSKTFGQHFSVKLSAENNKQLFVPRGFLHGFSVLSETAVFAYKCDNFYNKESELGVMYNDSSLAIDWMIEEKDQLISDKDKVNLSFEEYVECI